MSSSDSRVDCGVESGGHYRCLLLSSLSTTEVSYSFQVAAINRYGAGPFSGQVNATINGTGMYLVVVYLYEQIRKKLNLKVILSLEFEVSCYTKSRPPYSETSTEVTNEEMSRSASTAVPTDVSARSPGIAIITLSF